MGWLFGRQNAGNFGLNMFKFKFWNRLDGKFEDLDYYREFTDEISFYPNGDLKTKGNNWIPSIFTGLVDKNGKEIYSGDILLFDMGSEGPNPLSEVSFELGAFMWGKSALFEHLIQEPGNRTKIGLELVGNIFENPELLK